MDSLGRKLDHMTHVVFMHDAHNRRLMALDGNHRLTYLAGHLPKHDIGWPVFEYVVAPDEFQRWWDHPATDGRGDHPGIMQRRRP